MFGDFPADFRILFFVTSRIFPILDFEAFCLLESSLLSTIVGITVAPLSISVQAVISFFSSSFSSIVGYTNTSSLGWGLSSQTSTVGQMTIVWPKLLHFFWTCGIHLNSTRILRHRPSSTLKVTCFIGFVVYVGETDR